MSFLWRFHCIAVLFECRYCTSYTCEYVGRQRCGTCTLLSSLAPPHGNCFFNYAISSIIITSNLFSVCCVCSKAVCVCVARPCVCVCVCVCASLLVSISQLLRRVIIERERETHTHTHRPTMHACTLL